ncbi:hypothetical protein [Arthrobacter sp. PAMC 25486]|uniref:hypothetical protein n=1 Tax=Arthrobacter sp. PAMC 25486 TaxID=1494608 RepID=UPI0012FECC1D|nr:hypothetical protein [Arthrobacter sp. PAMC 25486]
MTARLYDLSSSWTLPTSQQEVWDVIACPSMAIPIWLGRIGGLAARWTNHWNGHPYAGASAAAALLATTTTLNFKASLGYTLSVSYHPTLVGSPNETIFEAGSEMEGEARGILSSTNNGQPQVDGEWRVRPTRRWMTFASPIASPAFTYADTARM